MLFAIKEILDVPRCAFVCAFDPIVVGDILGAYHPGFGDGLAFLEKIIDYPRYLPVPSQQSLLALVRHDIHLHCPYVPMEAMEHTIELLPQNPRLLRKFIRLIGLLRPQIDRHYDKELVWPIILGANLIKVSYPQLASDLLADRSLWRNVDMPQLFGKADENKLRDTLANHVKTVMNAHDCKLDEKEQQRIVDILKFLSGHISVWSTDSALAVYQMRVGEAPTAITWKEHDHFVAQWDHNPTKDYANHWIVEHATKVGQREQDVYREMISKTVVGRENLLSCALDEVTTSSATQKDERACVLMDILECLTFCLGRLDGDEKWLGSLEFEKFFYAMTRFLGWTLTSRQKAMRLRERDFMLRLVNDWSRDVSPLIAVLKPFSDPATQGVDGNRHLASFHSELCALVLPRYAAQLSKRFRESDFIRGIYGGNGDVYDAQHILLDVSGVLWNGQLRTEMIKILSEAPRDMVVHQNAYHMLLWCDHILREQANTDRASFVSALLADAEIRDAIWKAATAHELNTRPIGSLKHFPAALQARGLQVVLPEWWKMAVDGSRLQS